MRPFRQDFLVHFDMKSREREDGLVDYSYIFVKMYERSKNAGDPKSPAFFRRVYYFRKLSFSATERLKTRCPGAASRLSRQK